MGPRLAPLRSADRSLDTLQYVGAALVVFSLLLPWAAIRSDVHHSVPTSGVLSMAPLPAIVVLVPELPAASFARRHRSDPFGAIVGVVAGSTAVVIPAGYATMWTVGPRLLAEGESIYAPEIGVYGTVLGGCIVLAVGLFDLQFALR